MNQEVAKELKKEFKTGIFPTILLAAFVVIGAGVFASREQAAAVSVEAELVVISLGGVIMLLGVILWVVSWKLEDIRDDINEMKKQP